MKLCEGCSDTVKDDLHYCLDCQHDIQMIITNPVLKEEEKEFVVQNYNKYLEYLHNVEDNQMLTSSDVFCKVSAVKDFYRKEKRNETVCRKHS